MDTKLKNGNQKEEYRQKEEYIKKEEHMRKEAHRSGNAAKWMGILLTVLAAALFTALIPEFEKKAETHYEASGSVEIESEEFISMLLSSNYVFYKNVLDKSGSETYAYEELYLEEELEEAYFAYDSTDIEDERAYLAQREAMLQSAILKNAEFVEIGQLQGLLGIYASQIQRAASEIQLLYVEDIGKYIDYYILSKDTGTELKNTTRPIEGLLQVGSGEPFSAADDAYAYYVIMDYDAAGNLQNVSVKGKDADKLLKTLQTLEGGQHGRLLPEREAVETFAFYYGDTDNVEKLLTVRQKKPASATFIYAMTKEQINAFRSWGYGNAYLGEGLASPLRYYSYSQAGVLEVCQLFLLAIAVIVVLLALCRPRMLAGRKERKAPLEVVLTIAFLILAGSSYTLWFVTNVGDDNLLMLLNDSFPLELGMGMEYRILKNAISFCYFAFLFGIWYFCCLELSDILHGIRHYFQTRCLLYRLLSQIVRVCKSNYRRLKREVLAIDLGEDMGQVFRKLLFINFCLLATACLFWFFGIFGLLIYIFVLYCFLKKYIHKIQIQYGRLLEATNSIAEGHFNNSFEEDFGIFESYKEELYKVQDGFKKAVEEEVKSQRMKTELITNVSHDLKTPLTAIITYIDLLKEENITPEQRKEYLGTLERKSLRLKALIEDLFEVSKANSGNVKLEPVPVDICNLMRQVYLEYEDNMKQAGLPVRFTMPGEKVILDLDSQKTYRIFENLYINIIKYAMPDTRVFITAYKKEGENGCRDGIHIELKNTSAQELTGDPRELSERFVRGDASRNTEGSGLGLAIAKSFTELQGGSFGIEIDGDLFKVVLDW